MNESNNYIFFFTIILTAFFASCSTQSISTIEGYDFDVDKNQTNYFILPYGSVSIPDKWEKSNFNQKSKQQYFKNRDSITIAIAFGPCNKFEFNADNSKKEFEFLKAYYEWESEYFFTHGLTSRVIEKDSLNNYIIWNLHGSFNEEIIDNYFLFGEANCYVSNFSVLKTDKWSEKQKIEFLKNIYFNRKE